MLFLSRYSPLALMLILGLLASCSIERRHYLPGYHVEGRVASGQGRAASENAEAANDEWRVANEKSIEESTVKSQPPSGVFNESENVVVASASNEMAFASCSKSAAKPLATRHSPFATSHSLLEADTLKKPYKPQKQYREIDPVGRYAVITVLAGVALQKVAGILTWFEVIMPLSFGPGIFIPAFAIVLVGLGLSAYSAWRVRKNSEKYKKNEWGKAALAILGWQILMSALFAWLLGGLPIG